MTSSNQPKPIPIPAIIVYGTPTSPELTQASWFRAEEKEAAKAAAIGLKFSVIDIQTEAERALTVGIHEGVLKGSGRMIVGSVSSEVFRRIEDQVRKVAGGDTASKPVDTETPAAKLKSEQSTNTGPAATVAPSSAPLAASAASPDNRPLGAAPAAASTSKPEHANAAPPSPWDTLRVGSYVIAKYPNETLGWWPAIITAIDKRDFIVRWPDEPRTLPLKMKRKHIAIIHPELNTSRM